MRGPLHIHGTLKDLELRPGASVIARGAAAAPFAALLPLMETGRADDKVSPLRRWLMENMREDTEKEQRQE